MLGLPDRWFWAIAYAAFCVFVECLLNIGGLLVWEYLWWNRSFWGVWLVFFFGYFHLYVAMIIVIGMKSDRNKIITISRFYGLAVGMNIFGIGLMGWVYWNLTQKCIMR
jgi:hypothetical protein